MVCLLNWAEVVVVKQKIRVIFEDVGLEPNAEDKKENVEEGEEVEACINGKRADTQEGHLLKHVHVHWEE